ncbi:MAG: superoxide dismutase [Patescibacteria group bacterium]
MTFVLPSLPYGYKDLEPYIDEETMHLHHDKHHQAYVDNLNKALEGKEELLGKSIEDLLRGVDKVDESVRQAVINHGGGHANHSFFWKVMDPKGGEPEGKFLEAVNSTFGSVDRFKEEFSKKAMGVFGSGWAFLIKSPDGKLSLKRHSFQNSPLMHGNVPILGLDVWEHAYYLKYENRRAEYIDAWWNVVNWREVSASFDRQA